jgi:hypothetical protein
MVRIYVCEFYEKSVNIIEREIKKKEMKKMIDETDAG